MGYDHSSSNSTLWHHSSSLSRQEAPRLHIYEGTSGWEVGLIDFDVFYCRPTMLLNLLLGPQEIVKRSKELFAQVPPKDRVAVPQNPDRAEINENGLHCHVGQGG